MKHINSSLIVLVLSMLFLSSCESEYIPTTDATKQEYVVEGYVEFGEDANPTFVMLTRSIPFVGEVSADKFGELFVKGAKMSVFDGTNTVELTQLCLADLPAALRDQAALILGLNPDSIKTDICVYADLFDKINRREGGRYDLRIEVDGKVLTASTTTPKHVPLTEFTFKDIPGIPNDTLAQLFCRFQDPPGEPNFYRYFTASQGGGLRAPFGSVTNDNIFDGKSFEIPFNRASNPGEERDPFTRGYFLRGDSIVLKACTIDSVHFDFWSTRDFAQQNDGPFSSYTRVKSNIKGGLGVWGGYTATEYNLVVPK